MKAWAFTVRGEGTDAIEIDVYDIIADAYFGVSARSVRDMLRSSKAKSLKLRINSLGGDVFEASAIYTQIRDMGANVEVTIDGICASAATMLAMTGDRIRMGANAWFMIHNPWGGLMGSSTELRDWADVLDKMRDQMAALYAGRAKISAKEAVALMDAETWMTADEAKAKGFVDEIIANKKGAGNASAMAFACASRLRADFLNLPATLGSEADEVIAAGNAMDGSRGGVEIPEGDAASVKSHLANHRHEFDLKAPREGDSQSQAPAAPQPAAPGGEAGTETTTTAAGAAQEGKRPMNEEQLKAQHPELYAAILKKAAAGERDRVVAHLTMGESSGDMKTALAAVSDGTEMTATMQAKYMSAAMNRRDQQNRQADSNAAGAATAGAAQTAAAAADQSAADLGDQVVALMEKGRGTKSAPAAGAAQ